MSDVDVTDHAQLRWDARTADDSVAPETAWAHGVRVRGPDREMGVDEVRVHEPSETVLLCLNDSIVTVKTVDRLQPATAQAIEPVLNGGSA